MIRTHNKNIFARAMSQNQRNQGVRRKMYPVGTSTTKRHRDSLILATAQRVAAKIMPSFVTPPQSTLRVLHRRQASLVKILSGNAGSRYF